MIYVRRHDTPLKNMKDEGRCSGNTSAAGKDGGRGRRRGMGGWWGGHGGIPNRTEVVLIANFFGEDVGKVVITGNVANVGEAVALGFTDGVITHLDVAKAFRALGVGPVDTGFVVVEKGNSGGHEDIFEVKVGEDMGDVEKGFDAFIGSIDLGFGGAASGDGLTLGFPVDRASHPNKVSREGSRLEKVKEGWRSIRAGYACVLRTPVGIRQGTGRGGERKMNVGGGDG